MNEPTHLDLFSGIGGFALAAQRAGFRTIGFCENDKYCQKVLAKNFLANAEFIRGNRPSEATVQEGKFPHNESRISSARIFGNIFDLDGRDFYAVDLITGGFPCQPFSVAGKRRGAADNRAIWPEMLRVISEARPAWVLGENVPGIITMELDNVLSDLEGIGYACRSFVIPACAVDARHRRDRIWILGRNIPQGRNSEELRECPGQRLIRSSNSSISDPGCVSEGRTSGRTEADPRRSYLEPSGFCRWLAEPDVGRVAHGIPSRVDRLKGLGNAIVPQVAYEIMREIRKLI